MPEIAVCCAGSYIGLVGGEASFPVGKVNTLTLYPMSFQEFLSEYRPRLSEHYAAFLDAPRALNPLVHEQLWSSLLEYFYVGGMPEAVRQLVEAGELNADVCEQVSRIHEELLTGYRSDFAKHSGTVNAHHLHRIFEQVPRQLSRDADANAARFVFKAVVPKAERYRDLSGAIDWLKATGLVYSSAIVQEPTLPLAAHAKESMFKLYLFDIGLLHAMLGLAARDIVSASYGSYKGYVAENFVAAELRSAGVDELYSWKGASSEIEFLVPVEGHGAVPVEVKS
ncbi:MAG: ATP-binding protein, partial [Spirochaetia bacterium]